MKLAELMKAKGYSFQDLAEASGVGKATIARIVYGQAKEPHPSTKRKIANVFDLEIGQIDDFKEEPTEPGQDLAPSHAEEIMDHYIGQYKKLKGEN